MVQAGAERELSAGSYFRLPALLLRCTRPLSSAIAGTMSLTAVCIRAGITSRAVLAGLAMCAVTMFGFVINDILDFKKDTAAGVRRPIAMGSLSRQAALMFAIFLLLVAYILSLRVGAGGVVLVVTVIGLVLYTPSARRLPLLKGMFVAGLCVSPLYYASFVSRGNASWAAYAVLALFVLGRETLMDAHEIAGDRQADMRTIAVVLGQQVARRLGTAMMIVALTCLNLVARGVVGKTAAMASVVSLLGVLLWPGVDEGRRISISRIPMLAAAVAVATG
jgi:4-hydroxybenzoate polyprenyltransferase